MRQKGSLQAIVFDFDGTLFDTSSSIVDTFNAVLQLHGRDPWPASELRLRIGRPLLEMFVEAMEVSHERARVHMTEYRREARQHHFKIVPFPGASRLTENLSAGARLGIATSRSSWSAADFLRKFGMDEHFGAIVGIDSVDNPKPHPEPVNLALYELGVDAEYALFVGDTPDDIVAARQAGAIPVGVATGAFSRDQLREAGAHHVLVDLVELEAFIEQEYELTGGRD